MCLALVVAVLGFKFLPNCFQAWTHAESHRSFRTVTQGPEARVELSVGQELRFRVEGLGVVSAPWKLGLRV